MTISIFFSSIILFSAWLLTVLALPYVRRAGLRYGAIDNPSSRKQHTTPIVRLGGVAMIIGLFFAWFLFGIIGKENNLDPLNNHFVLVIILGSLTFFLIGLADDFFKISPFFRLGLQAIASFFVSTQGLGIKALDLSFISPDLSIIVLPSVFSTLLTVIWFTGITNSINWLDGLDGLAAGFAVIAFGFFHYLSSSNLHEAFSFLVSALIGSSLGFLTQNSYPARILMGDSGSYLLGFNLAALSILGFTSNISYPFNSYSSFNIIIPTLIMIVPAFDMVLVILLRLSNGRSPFYPDRSHLHHRILNLGFSHQQTVFFAYLLSLLFGFIAFILSEKNIELNSVAVFSFSLLLFSTIIIRKIIR